MYAGLSRDRKREFPFTTLALLQAPARAGFNPIIYDP